MTRCRPSRLSSPNNSADVDDGPDTLAVDGVCNLGNPFHISPDGDLCVTATEPGEVVIDYLDLPKLQRLAARVRRVNFYLIERLERQVRWAEAVLW